MSLLFYDNAARLKVERNGTSIKLYANGQVLTYWTDALHSGVLFTGLEVASGSQPQVDIYFDNFTVYSTVCGSSAVRQSSGATLPLIPQVHDLDPQILDRLMMP